MHGCYYEDVIVNWFQKRPTTIALSAAGGTKEIALRASTLGIFVSKSGSASINNLVPSGGDVVVINPLGDVGMARDSAYEEPSRDGTMAN